MNRNVCSNLYNPIDARNAKRAMHYSERTSRNHPDTTYDFRYNYGFY